MNNTKLHRNKPNRNFSNIISKGEKFYKSFGYNTSSNFNHNIFEKAPFMWFASKKNIADMYKNQTNPITYTFHLTKDVNLININSNEFIKDFTKKINTIFAEHEHMRNILFFPFGNIPPLFQNFYQFHLLHEAAYSSLNIINDIKSHYSIHTNIYEKLLKKGKRISRLSLDSILMFVLMKLYPNYDGYISHENDFNFHSEICLFNPFEKIELTKNQNGGVINSNNQKNINIDINNPLLYNIEENLNLILKLKKYLDIFTDNVIKNNVINTYNEILNLTKLEYIPKIINNSNS